MPYCRSCGAQIPDNAAFCPSCGTAVVAAASSNPVYSSVPQPQSEFDRFTTDSKTRELWIRRLAAYVIDWIIVTIATAIIVGIIALATGLTSLLLTSNFGAFFVPFGPFASGILGLSALLFLLYFVILEGMRQKTIGKSLLGLKVVSLDNQPVGYEKSFIRNLSKIYWVLLLLDLIFGFFTDVRPGQKFSDKIAHTVVVSTSYSNI